MLRLVALASLALAAIQGDATQSSSVLHIKVSIVDADKRPVPVARHALLISDNPPTVAPRRVVTTPEGTAEIRLRPGNYTVESDRPVALLGRAYQWTKVVDVVAGRDITIELTAANAEVGPITAGMEATPTATTPAEEPPASSLLAKWQGSVVALWTEHRHAAGFIVGGKGLVATSQSAIGDATSIEVQLSPTDKVAGRVLASDPVHDLAIVQIDPAAATHAPPVPLACGSADATGAAIAQDPLTIDVPLFGAKRVLTDVALPNFVPAICDLVASAEQRIAAAPPPSAAHLPVESSKPLPVDTASVRGFSLSPYVSSSSDFDILFITPALLAGAKLQQGRTGGATDTLSGLRAVTEFADWSRYVSESPPVLFIRATPKLVESFWMKLARGAASTQGTMIPPIKHIGPGFSRMRVLCGTTEIVPVHPFRIRTPVSETEAVDEGFYAFDPVAIGPQCGKVSLVLSSVKDPGKTETRVIDPAVIAQVWKDFAAWREQ